MSQAGQIAQEGWIGAVRHDLGIAKQQIGKSRYVLVGAVARQEMKAQLGEPECAVLRSWQVARRGIGAA
jgi:hypothetical protein